MVPLLLPELGTTRRVTVANLPANWETPPCNLCGGTAVTVLLPNAKSTGMNLVECDRCGLRFFSPRPNWHLVRSQISCCALTAELAFRTGSLIPGEKRARERVLGGLHVYYGIMLHEAIDAFGRVPDSLFEIGSGVGWFQTCAREWGIPLITGIDVDECAVEIARRKLQLDVLRGDFLEYEAVTSYDMVAALDYLEHTYHPREDLDKMVAMLNPGGVLLAKTFLDELDLERSQLSPPVHSIHWTTRTLQRELTDRGLEIVSWRPDYGGYFIIIIARRLGQ